MEVWDGVSGARISFDWGTGSSSTTGEKSIAHMIENGNITSALLSRIQELGDVTVYDNSRVQHITLGDDNEDLDLRSWPVVSLSSGQSLAARLLIGADGANSSVRNFAGIQSRGWDYGRHGVVATLKLEREQLRKIAYQRFLPTGPVALLPLPGDMASLVWSTMPDHAAHLKTLSKEGFVAMVNAAFRLSTVDIAYMHTMSAGQTEELDWREKHTAFDKARIPHKVDDVQEGSVASFPLKMRHADTYIGDRVALIGYSLSLPVSLRPHQLTCVVPQRRSTHD